LRNETLHWNADKVTRLQNRLQARRALTTQPILLALGSAPPPLRLSTETPFNVTTDRAQTKVSIEVDSINAPTGGSTEIGEIGEKDGKFEVIIKDTLAALVTNFITSLTTSVNIVSQAELHADVISNATASAETPTIAIATATAGTVDLEPSVLLKDKMDADTCTTTDATTDTSISTAISSYTEESDPDGDSEDSDTDNEWILL
jgi:hypothetical protein